MTEEEIQTEFPVIEKTHIPNEVRTMGNIYELKPKKCAWCPNLIYLGQKKIAGRFCSIDCKEEYFDWKSIIRYQRQKDKQKREYSKSNKQYLGRDKEKIKLRKKKYYQEHKEKIKAQMVEIRKRNKLKQNASQRFNK